MTQDIEKFGIKFQDDNVKFAYRQALKRYGKRLKQSTKREYKFNNRPITQEDLNRVKRAIDSKGVSSLPPMRSTGTVMQKSNWFEVLKFKRRFKKVVRNKKTGRTKTVRYGQAGKAKDGGDRIRPSTKKGDAYCARSMGIKRRLPKEKRNDPNSPNNLSRKKWKCKGEKSTR